MTGTLKHVEYFMVPKTVDKDLAQVKETIWGILCLHLGNTVTGSTISDLEYYIIIAQRLTLEAH